MEKEYSLESLHTVLDDWHRLLQRASTYVAHSQQEQRRTYAAGMREDQMHSLPSHSSMDSPHGDSCIFAFLPSHLHEGERSSRVGRQGM